MAPARAPLRPLMTSAWVMPEMVFFMLLYTRLDRRLSALATLPFRVWMNFWGSVIFQRMKLSATMVFLSWVITSDTGRSYSSTVLGILSTVWITGTIKLMPARERMLTTRPNCRMTEYSLLRVTTTLPLSTSSARMSTSTVTAHRAVFLVVFSIYVHSSCYSVVPEPAVSGAGVAAGAAVSLMSNISSRVPDPSVMMTRSPGSTSSMAS